MSILKSSYLSLLPGCFFLASGSVVAEEVHDVFKTVTTQIPHTQRICETVEVPVYGNGPMNTEGAIVGGIVGGLLGNTIGKGSGNKVATGTGALAGAILGGQSGSQQIVGYRQEQNCRDDVTYTTESKQVYSYSVVNFDYEGKKYSLRFTK